MDLFLYVIQQNHLISPQQALKHGRHRQQHQPVFPLAVMKRELETEKEVIFGQVWKVRMEFSFKWNEKLKWILFDKSGIKMRSCNYSTS